MYVRTIFIIISSSLAIISPIIYALSILRGKTKPHRTTRLVLLIITALSTISLFAEHDTVAVWLAGISTLQAILIFFLSIKHGLGGWSRFDIICLIIAFIGIVAWQTTDNPALGLYFSILADFIGMVPAIVKTYKFPQSETVWFFGFDMVAGIFTLLAVISFSVQQTAYPIYIVFINAVMVALILKPKFLNVA